MKDYSENGYDKFLSRRKELPKKLTEDKVSVMIEQLPVQAIKEQISSQRVIQAVTDIVQITGVTEASTAPLAVANNSGVRLIATLQDLTGKSRVMFGVCEVTPYMDSISNANAIPYGSDAIANGHKNTERFDYLGNTTRRDGRDLTYISHIQNNTGSSHGYTYQVRFRYIGNKTSGSEVG